MNQLRKLLNIHSTIPNVNGKHSLLLRHAYCTRKSQNALIQLLQFVNHCIHNASRYKGELLILNRDTQKDMCPNPFIGPHAPHMVYRALSMHDLPEQTTRKHLPNSPTHPPLPSLTALNHNKIINKHFQLPHKLIHTIPIHSLYSASGQTIRAWHFKNCWTPSWTPSHRKKSRTPITDHSEPY